MIPIFEWLVFRSHCTKLSSWLKSILHRRLSVLQYICSLSAWIFLIAAMWSKSSSLVWLDHILKMLLLVRMSILTDQQESLPYPSPLSLLRRSKCSFMCSNNIALWLNWLKDQLKMLGEESFNAKRASEIVVQPKEMLLSFSCVWFLTN